MKMMADRRIKKPLGLLLMAVLGAAVALASLLALQWASPAQANEQGAGGAEIKLERGTDQGFPSVESGSGEYQPQIVGGTAVPNGKYPFMVYMEVQNSDGTSLSCGGTLIDRDSVLTAAHCLRYNPTAVDLVVGRTVLSQNQGQIRYATAGWIHPRYNGQRNFAYDVAVLKLNRVVSGIRPVTLPTPTQNAFEKPGRLLTVAGWGHTREGGAGTDRMREVSVPVVSDSRAQTAYSSLPSIYRYFPTLMVAAGKKGKDSCQGDSGGPLFNPGTTRTQVGVVSYGLGCARSGYPGAYTEVNNTGIRNFILASAKK